MIPDTKELRAKISTAQRMDLQDRGSGDHLIWELATQDLPGLLDEMDRLTEDNGALADRVALHYEEWHAEGEKRVKAEADLAAMKKRLDYYETGGHAADLAALRERIEGIRKAALAHYEQSEEGVAYRLRCRQQLVQEAEQEECDMRLDDDDAEAQGYNNGLRDMLEAIRSLSDDRPATEDTERCVRRRVSSDKLWRRCDATSSRDYWEHGPCRNCGKPIQVKESDDA